MKQFIKNAAAALIRALARIAVGFNNIFNHDGSSRNPAGKGTENQARPRRRLVDGVDVDRFTRLCVVIVVGFVTAIGAILIAVTLRSGGHEIPVAPGSGDDTPDGFVLSLGGDVMPTQDMLESARGEGGYNFHNYLAGLSGALSGDLTVAGLCGQINVSGSDVSVSGFNGGMNYPDALAAALSQSGVNYVMGANRYAFVNGYDGMCASVSNLHTKAVGVVGLTDTDPQKLNTRVMCVGGVSVGVAGYNCVGSDSYKALRDEQKTYIAQVPADADALAERAAADIKSMRSGGAEFIVICVGWGGADSLAPSAFIKDAASKLAEAGADVVVGYGPYVTMPPVILSRQNGSVTKDCYVFYSLGTLMGDNRYGSKKLETLSKVKKPSDAQKKQLQEEKKKAAEANKAMTRSMTVNLTVTRAKNGSVNVESATFHPVFLVRNTAQDGDTAYLKYTAVEAARYLSAEERPAIFADDKQWQLCREAYTAICALTEGTEGRLVPAAPDEGGETDTRI